MLNFSRFGVFRAFSMSFVVGGVVTSLLAADIPEPKFEAQTIDGKILIGYGVAVGDVDGDKRPDVLVADKKQFVWYQNPGPRKEGEAFKDWPKHIMAENLTEHDNVCLAARDINGDGKVEVAVGAQWNPGNTDDPDQSGAIFYLERPEDPTQPWNPVRIEPHDPTTHRMLWLWNGAMNDYRLAVLPLHGVGNRNGEGKPVRIQIVTPPEDTDGEWTSEFIDTKQHMTHNFTPWLSRYSRCYEMPFIAGREGTFETKLPSKSFIMGEYYTFDQPHSAGEVARSLGWFATIEPMHGNQVVAYVPRPNPDPDAKFRTSLKRIVLDDTLNQGHALACADLLGLGRDQVIAGWRQRNAYGKVGIKLYVPRDDAGKEWTTHWIDDNTMACEDLKVADLDGDGKLDVVASGRGTQNVVIYWNRSE